MNKLFALLICMFCYGNNTFNSYRSSINVSIDTSILIKKIQSDFMAVNKQLSHYKRKSREAPEMSAEGGKITGYYNKYTLKKIHCVFYGEMGKTETDYYFNPTGLFFLYKKQIFYDKPMYLTDFKVSNINEMRYYIHKKKIVKSISKPNTSAIESYNVIEEELKQITKILNEK